MDIPEINKHIEKIHNILSHINIPKISPTYNYKHDDKKNKETIINTFMNIAEQIFNNVIALTSNEISYGGSLDARTIFETAKSMKIGVGNVRRIYDENIHGIVLQSIKNNRNWLAHGEKSFSEVGSLSTYTQLNDAKNHVNLFLIEFINSVELYLQNEDYKLKVV
ncbi:MAG TPA: MAE_28990/MAE_18760 family HEPN-like nuclease [Chitinophagales bacterium]|nr:MAE_28990/MAE_18760 family HEPN-like nuclease [Chitinophagales bacterium]